MIRVNPHAEAEARLRRALDAQASSIRALGQIGVEPHEWAQEPVRPRVTGPPICDCEGCQEDSRDPLSAAKGILLGVLLGALFEAFVIYGFWGAR